MAELEHFIFNSDYPMDKIVWLKQGELKLSDTGYGEATLEHGVGAQLYVKGLWSTDDWATANMFGAKKFADQYLSINSNVWANDKNVTFNVASDPNTTLKYKLWGVVNEADTKNLDTSRTVGYSANRLFLSTDLNYPKLVAEGHLGKGEIYQHGQGKIPFVDIWDDNPYIDGYMPIEDSNPEDAIAWVTDSEIKVTSQDLTNGIYYRIYG